MLQLKEAENWNEPVATTWAAEFLLREGESRDCLGSWINSSAVHEAKKRRAKQVITCSFPCGKWLHMIGARASPGCELCKRERRKDMASTDTLPIETMAHIQSPGCKAQKKSVIGAHNRCWGYLRDAISTHGEAKRNLEFIGGDQGRLFHETDPYNEVIFGRRRPDSVAIEWTSKTLYVLEFKRTSDQRQDYRERGESRARAQHDVLVKSLEEVAKGAEGESAGWTVKLIIFLGGTCGSVHLQTFNNNLKELEVVESKRNAIRKGFVHELLNAQDTVLCSYFAQRSGAKGDGCGQKSTVEEAFQGLDRFE